MFDLKAYLEESRLRINAALTEILRTETAENRLIRAMTHSLMAGGKRVRPVLCLAAAKAVGGEPDHALPAACALEMIHTYSLIHDDLPAMDDDDLRRGQPTCHAAFDEATAILAGDALQALAFEALAKGAMTSLLPPSLWLQVIYEISVAAGSKGMVEGQMLDLAAEKRPPEHDALERLHSLKTGAMIEVSVVSGARLGGGSEEQVAALRRYAAKIGLAFQVVDDILNVEGDPAVMGKAAGTDAERRKTTYPSLMGKDGSKAFAKRLIDEAVDAVAGFGEAGEPLRAIARYIIERNR